MNLNASQTPLSPHTWLSSPCSVLAQKFYMKSFFFSSFCLLTFWFKYFQITFFVFFKRSIFSLPSVSHRSFIFVHLLDLQWSFNLSFSAFVWQYFAKQNLQLWKIFCNLSWLKTFFESLSVKWFLNYLRFKRMQSLTFYWEMRFREASVLLNFL